MTLVFTAVTSKNDVTLCKLDVNVKNRKAITGNIDFFKLLSRNPLTEKFYFIASSSLKIKCGKSKGMQEKVSIMGVWGVARKICHLGSLFGIFLQAS